MQTPISKNIVYGSITAGGNVHIGDVTYIVEKEFSRSILFLRIEPGAEGEYNLQLSVKSSQATNTRLDTSGENLLHEAVRVRIPPRLLDTINDFQKFRRKVDDPMRDITSLQPMGVAVHENRLSQLLFDTFFSGDIGQVCADFIQWLEARRIEELLLVISTDDDGIANLPFEMVLPRLFPPRQGQAKKSLAVAGFGLVRTRVPSLGDFKVQGGHSKAAPLKMLFITALPENLDENSKMLQIEEEQARLIRAIGGLEATGDNKPKIAIEFLDNASLEELDKALQARQHDIVHISGHGAYHAGENKGVLYFENEDGDEEQISGAALGETLRRHSCVRLLVLSACETAVSGSEGGVAQQLAHYGVPGIVSMRFAVTDEGAKVFTTEFYTQLTRGLSVTGALAYAREELYKAVEQKREQAPGITHLAEWFTPVIYQNQALGPLIEPSRPYIFPEQFYTKRTFTKTGKERLIGAGFIGRKRYLIQMRRAFRAGRHICLNGQGGLGKTTLAEAFAHHYDNRSHGVHIFRKDHQINEAYILNYLNKKLEKINKDVSEDLQWVIEDPQMEVTEKLQFLIANFLDGRKTILIFDNMEDVQLSEGDEYRRDISSLGLREFLRYFCENAPADCHILFTTRYKIQDLDDVVEHLALDKLGYAEQYRLLNYSTTLRSIPVEEREKLYKRLDGHPRGYEYLEALLKKDKSFRWQQVADAEERVFENLLLRKVVERLDEREKALFQLVAVFIARTPQAALAALSGEAEEDLLPVLQSLQDWSLCHLEKDGRFEVHRLTREWMQRHITPAEKVKEWARKAGEYFENQPDWDDYELSISYYRIAEEWVDFARISFRLQGEYLRIGQNRQAIELNQQVLDQNIDEKTNAEALNYIGLVHLRTGSYDEALYSFEQSLNLYQAIGDREGEGMTLNNIGYIYNAKGDYDRALDYLKKSLAISQAIGDRPGEGTTSSNIGQTYSLKGDYDCALGNYEKSLAISQAIGDRQGEAGTLSNIGQIYSLKGDYDCALGYLEKSLAISQAIGDHRGEAGTLSYISLIFHAKGDYEGALGNCEKSLAISQVIGDRQIEGTTLNNIGHIYSAKSDYDRALDNYEKSLAISQAIGDRKSEGNTLNNIGQIYGAKGDYDRALGYLEQSLVILQAIGDRKGEGATLNSIGHIYHMQGDYDCALGNYEKSLVISQAIGDRQGEGTTLNNIGPIHYSAKGDYDRALGYLEQSLAIQQAIGDRKGEGATLNNIGHIYNAKGDYDRALKNYEKSLAIRQAIGDISGLATTLNNMGAIYLEQKNDMVRAVYLFSQAYRILEQLGSPDIQHPTSYLQAIIGQIGEEKFREIIADISSNDQ